MHYKYGYRFSGTRIFFYGGRELNEITRVIAADLKDDEADYPSPRMINPQLHTGSTVLFESCQDLLAAGRGGYSGITYGTERLPVQRKFENALADMEGGALCRAFQSGISAITNTLLAFTRSGDHILVCENVYGPTSAFCREVLSRYGVTTTFVPAAVGQDIDQWLTAETRLIFLESPGSNTFEIQDIQAVVEIAREKGIVTIIDNTWATPLFLKPLELGVDVSIHSVTKYISGHSDVLLGAVTVNGRYADVLDRFYRVMELFASPQDCYLALRGLKTLGVRMRQHQESGLAVGVWLEQNDLVEKVIHPALESHPQHKLWKKDFTGAAGLFSFVFKENYSEEQVCDFVNALKLFGIGFSWGGYKSLVTVGRYRRESGEACEGKVLVRLNVGLEEVDDLIADLQQAFLMLA
ncbi:cystathionine beta-lyase [Desulfosediminicola ganghwensis]|uniref:cystathionine beta-lyase n=1 Tax=Desulfosediminicola ganghwensis TaxID=2569540 RepID=UPI001C3CEC75|nr:cystathionine beta-lyase [Desulfosediminicola ganghwensis]